MYGFIPSMEKCPIVLLGITFLVLSRKPSTSCMESLPLWGLELWHPLLPQWGVERIKPHAWASHVYLEWEITCGMHFVEHLRIYVCYSKWYTHIPLDYSKVDLMLWAFAVEVEGRKKVHTCHDWNSQNSLYYVSAWYCAYLEKIYLCLSNVLFFNTSYLIKE